MSPVFCKGNILLPKEGLEAWSVVACDQFTSDPGYWERVERLAGDRPSACRIIFPEAQLGKVDFEGKIASINAAMASYLRDGVFREERDCMVYVERTLLDGSVRRGIVGLLDLTAYDFHKGSRSLIRATEGTVLDRLPPRVRIREDAPLESPHILVLIDDPERGIVEPLHSRTGAMESLYDFDLMLGGGHIAGWRLTPEDCDRVQEGLARLGDPAAFREKYGLGPDVPPMVFAMGDGNHSLATAKECYNRLVEKLGEEAAKAHPARYALVELGNLHDDSLRFEPIHRAVFEVEEGHFLSALESWCAKAAGDFPAQAFRVLTREGEQEYAIPHPPCNLTVGSVQSFLDEYTGRLGGRVDYIHGAEEARRLAREGAVCILLDVMGKDQLFPTVILEGALPRKTFSMGEAPEKRYYLECRRIKDDK